MILAPHKREFVIGFVIISKLVETILLLISNLRFQLSKTIKSELCDLECNCNLSLCVELENKTKKQPKMSC